MKMQVTTYERGRFRKSECYRNCGHENIDALRRAIRKQVQPARVKTFNIMGGIRIERRGLSQEIVLLPD